MPILWGYLINWLDQMARYLEAIEAVVKMLGKERRQRKRGRGTDWGINGEGF